MLIKHRLTGQEEEISFHSWKNRGNKHNYDVIDYGDTVYVRESLGDNKVAYRYQIDRDHAVRMVSSHADRFDFVELNKIPLELKVKLVLSHILNTENRNGNLREVLKLIGIDELEAAENDYLEYMDENDLAKYGRSKDGAFLVAKSGALRFVNQHNVVEGEVFEEELIAEVELEKKALGNRGLRIRAKLLELWKSPPSRLLQVLGLIVTVGFGLHRIFGDSNQNQPYEGTDEYVENLDTNSESDFSFVRDSFSLALYEDRKSILDGNLFIDLNYSDLSLGGVNVEAIRIAAKDSDGAKVQIDREEETGDLVMVYYQPKEIEIEYKDRYYIIHQIPHYQVMDVTYHFIIDTIASATMLLKPYDELQ